MRPECLQPTYHLIDAVQLLGAKIIMIINGKAILMRIRMLLLECHYLATQWGYERKLSNATTTLKLTLTCWISTSCNCKHKRINMSSSILFISTAKFDRRSNGKAILMRIKMLLLETLPHNGVMKENSAKTTVTLKLTLTCWI